MSLWKHSRSPYWQIRFKIAGIKVRRSSETTDKRAAKELEDTLRADLRRKIRDGGGNLHTWDDAVAKCKLEDSTQKSWDRTERSIKILSEYLSGSLLTEIDYNNLLRIRELLSLRDCSGHGWKTKRQWKPSTTNRVLAVAGSILTRCADPDTWNMLPRAPKIPLYELEETERKWLTREKAVVLLGRFPQHTRDMAIFALATGLRKSNVAELPWERVDLDRRCCYVPGYETKSGEPIPVALNADAMAVLERWKVLHEEMGEEWSAQVHRYVFVYRRRAPIKQLTTRMWRRECAAVGLPGLTFHTMRHTWASWQAQAGTTARVLQDLGGWSSTQMPNHYTHLDPGHLAGFADRTVISGVEGVTQGVTLKRPGKKKRVSACFDGKGGTRTLDPGIMRIVGVRKAS
jgi:integrase